jgi:hypothetical protein
MEKIYYKKIGLKYNNSLKRRVIEYQVINSPIAGNFTLFREEHEGHLWKWIDTTGPSGNYVDHFDFAKAHIDRHEGRRPYSRFEEFLSSRNVIPPLS